VRDWVKGQTSTAGRWDQGIIMILGIEWQKCAVALCIVIALMATLLVVTAVMVSGRISEAEREAMARWEREQRR
jgi:hypothetical protein